jgi:hypothetical protein
MFTANAASVASIAARHRIAMIGDFDASPPHLGG